MQHYWTRTATRKRGPKLVLQRAIMISVTHVPFTDTTETVPQTRFSLHGTCSTFPPPGRPTWHLLAMRICGYCCVAKYLHHQKHYQNTNVFFSLLASSGPRHRPSFLTEGPPLPSHDMAWPSSIMTLFGEWNRQNNGFTRRAVHTSSSSKWLYSASSRATSCWVTGTRTQVRTVKHSPPVAMLLTLISWKTERTEVVVGGCELPRVSRMVEANCIPGTEYQVCSAREFPKEVNKMNSELFFFGSIVSRETQREDILGI